MSACGGEDVVDGEPATSPACAALEITVADGECARPGIPLDGCADGFVHDGAYGCNPTLPVETCPPGLMAVPGETVCRVVKPCGAGTWGDIPIEVDAQHVDASYVGADSDGSSTRPWTKITDAIVAATPGAMVAIAEGSYGEDVDIGKRVRLWGVCPEKVEVVGQAAIATLLMRASASGTELHGMAVRGPQIGIAIGGANQVLLEGVWVHDTGWRGVAAELNAEGARIENSLIESAEEVGIALSGADAEMIGSVVRATRPRSAGQLLGRGVSVQLSCGQTGCDPTTRPHALIQGSVIEGNHEFGMYLSAADATVEGSVVRNTVPRASDSWFGRGIHITPSCLDDICDPSTRANVTIRGTIVERNHESAVTVMGSDAVLETTVLRTTWPRVLDQRGGNGINIQLTCSITGCIPSSRANVRLTRSLVEDVNESGVLVANSDSTLVDSVVRLVRTRPDGSLGDGVASIAFNGPATVNVERSLIHEIARAGIASFGSSGGITASTITCTAFPLNGEDYDGQEFALQDRGGNKCGCPAASQQCRILSAGLTPPDALE
jgi:hypothetical protein